MHSSGNSKPNLVVKDIRFATMLMEKSKRIGNVKETGLYAVPLTRSSTKIDTATFNRCVFDAIAVRENARPFQMDRMEEHKTILLMGAPDSGKTSIIHSLFNFIVGVDLKDPFRFLLKEDGQDETQSISVYEIHYADGFRIPYPLTIIDVSFCYDTPSKEFSEILGKFFLCEDQPCPAAGHGWTRSLHKFSTDKVLRVSFVLFWERPQGQLQHSFDLRLLERKDIPIQHLPRIPLSSRAPQS